MKTRLPNPNSAPGLVLPKSPIPEPRETKRMALYARVSSDEQTKGNYPSCVSQIEELEAECRRTGRSVAHVIKDEGYSAGSLKRPGLTQLRWLVQSGEIDGILCTWYDRLTRSREFYTLDNEFKAHQIEFITLNDRADTNTAAGRYMESMIVAAKTYERDQTSEKVCIKMRQRQEKGMHQGGVVPFGFLCDPVTKILSPDPAQADQLKQLFHIYIDRRSDFAVRDWLESHGIPTPRGKGRWQVSTIRDLLSNRRYIGEIEINRKSKGVEGLSEAQSYRIVPAPHGPLLPRSMFEMAQKIRNEKSFESAHRIGRPRSYSTSRCGRVNLLQGLLLCGQCGHAMAPHYTAKPARGDRPGYYIHYYVCADQIKSVEHCGHKNRVAAPVAESWALEAIKELVTTPDMIETALEQAYNHVEAGMEPHLRGLEGVRAALHENAIKIEQMLEAIGSGSAVGPLLGMLNEKAALLHFEKERLLTEQRQLQRDLEPFQRKIDAAILRKRLQEFDKLAEVAEPEELQRLLRWVYRRIEWEPEGANRMQIYAQPLPKKKLGEFATNMRLDGPDRWKVEPVFLEISLEESCVFQLSVSLLGSTL